MPDFPILSLWRSEAPNRLRARANDLHAELDTRCRGLVKDESLNRTLTDTPEHAFAVLEELRGEATGDLIGSWLAWAAAKGDELARHALIQTLIDLANTERHGQNGEPGKPERLLRLAAQWQEMEHLPGFGSSDGRKFIFSALIHLQRLEDAARQPKQPVKLSQYNDGWQDEADQEKPKESNGPSVTVIADLKVPTQREAKQMVEDFQGLAKPVPLVGSALSPAQIGLLLSREFPWMTAAVDALVAELGFSQSLGQLWFRFRPLLLDGPPGVGKTRFARRLAELSGLGFRAISAAGSSDDRMLRGTARGWSNCQPALPLTLMRDAKAANPVILVDEIDKTRSDGRNGDIRATLLTMLEPQTARAWYDEALLAECDLSHINWILTCNDATALSDPLRSRLRLVTVGKPGAKDFDALLSGILHDIATEYGTTIDALPPLHPQAEAELRKAFTEQNLSPRRLSRAVQSCLSAVAAQASEMRAPH